MIKKIIKLILLCSLLFQIPAYATTSTTVYTSIGSNIEVNSISASSTSYSANDIFTVTGVNLPILSPNNGISFSGPGGGYEFPNFWFGNSQWGAVGNSSVQDNGINIIFSSTNELQFTPNFANGPTNMQLQLYLAPDGQSLLSVGQTTPSNEYMMGDFNLSSNVFQPSVTVAPVVNISNTSLTSISLSWNAVNGASTYNIYENGNSIPFLIGVKGTTSTVSGLSQGSQYSFQVAGVNVLGTGPLSTAVPGATAALIPPIVTSIPTSIGSIVLSWNPTIGANSYDIFVNGKLDISDLAQTSVTLSNLPLNQSASIQVYAVDALGNLSLPSATQNVTPTLAAPSLTFSHLTNKSVTLNWTPVPGATSYQIYENDPTLVDTTSSTTATINNLSAGTPYTFTVNAVTPNGTSLSSTPVSLYAPTIYFGFDGSTIFDNALAIIASLASLLLLALAVEFSPRLLTLIKKVPTQVPSNSEYDPEYSSAQTSSTTEIPSVHFEE